MKRILSIILSFVLIFSLVACSEQNQPTDNSPTEIHFGTKVSELKKLDGKEVVLIGYMSALEPIDGRIAYIMNAPLQTCPFCVSHEETLVDTMAISGTDVGYTSAPVKITGTLVFGFFEDAYGSQYTYRIQNAKITKLTTDDDIPENMKKFIPLSIENLCLQSFIFIENIMTVAFYDEAGIAPEDINKVYGELPELDIVNIKKVLNENGEENAYADFLELIDKAEVIRVKLNEDIKNNNIEAYKTYQDELNKIADAMSQYFMEFTIR